MKTWRFNKKLISHYKFYLKTLNCLILFINFLCLRIYPRKLKLTWSLVDCKSSFSCPIVAISFSKLIEAWLSLMDEISSCKLPIFATSALLLSSSFAKYVILSSYI